MSQYHRALEGVEVTHFEPAIVGTIRLDYTSVIGFEERWFYDARDSVGMPTVRWEMEAVPGGTGATWELWRAKSTTPFGEIIDEVNPTERPPWGFRGQILLANSDVDAWSGSTIQHRRPELMLNQWRIYDPAVGQYLTPEPLAVMGAEQAIHPYAYAEMSPANYIDETGWGPCPVKDWQCICAKSPSQCMRRSGEVQIAGIPHPGVVVEASVVACCLQPRLRSACASG